MGLFSVEVAIYVFRVHVSDEMRKLTLVGYTHNNALLIIPANNMSIKENQENIELLRKYKKIADDGIITKEEFDAKKKQLLGL